MSDARLLAFDTSTEQLSVGVCTPAGRWCCTEAGGAQASARLIPLALELLQQAGVALQSLHAVAFGRGPGAFTGLRTSCAVAQGFAFGANLPVLPIDSLMITAEDAATQLPAQAHTMWAAMDARMDEVYAGAYRRDGSRWVATVQPALWTLDALAAAWRADAPQAVAGSAVDAFAQRLPFGSAALVPRPQDRAAALLRLAEAAWQAGEAVDAAQALPVYLRDKVALTTAERALKVSP